MNKRLTRIYQKLYAAFGPQYWWPADTPFEVMAGAILTQNTNWSNVEKAVANLKKEKLLSPRKLFKAPLNKIARLIRPSGYYNVKAGRLKEFSGFLCRSYQGSIRKMARQGHWQLRRQLLAVKGIGEETADSILLYSLSKPVFVVDAYTRRILLRHRLIKEGAGYQDVQNLFMENIKNRLKLFNEYHALLVRVGKDFCFKNNPRCQGCPLGG
ncbi:MAG: endonuclease III domain-containing protein [Candidatus Omnitrophota bacterium]|jgi:endonuclease-3 related protein